MTAGRLIRTGAAASLLAVLFLGQARAETLFRMDEVAAGQLDPAKASDFADGILMFNLYDTLVASPPGGGELQPSLAESWSQDGSTFTFTLREGVTFHSGNPLRAEDVVFSFNRLMELGQGHSNLFLGRVESVEALDDRTVRFTLSSPYAPFLAALNRLAIVDEATVMANVQPGDFGDKGDYGQAFLSSTDAGTGAYTVERHDPQNLTVMRRFDGYFAGLDTAAPDVGHLRYGLEPATSRVLLETGEHELSSPYLPPEVLSALADKEGVRVLAQETSGGFYFKLNTQRAPLDNRHCRRALALALDYDALLQVQAINGTPGAFPATGPLVEGMLGWSPGTPVSARDLEAARSELELCPHDMQANPVEIGWITEVPIEERFALIMQASFAEIGVASEIVGMPWALFTESAAKPETTAHINQVVVLPTTPDPDSLLFNMYHSSAQGTWMSAEWFANGEMDRLLEEGRSTMDAAARQAVYEEIVDMLLEEMPTIFAFGRVHNFAARDAAVIKPLDDPSQGYILHEMNFMLRDVRMQ